MSDLSNAALFTFLDGPHIPKCFARDDRGRWQLWSVHSCGDAKEDAELGELFADQLVICADPEHRIDLLRKVFEDMFDHVKTVGALSDIENAFAVRLCSLLFLSHRRPNH
jgi:hypothetical protein